MRNAILKLRAVVYSLFLSIIKRESKPLSNWDRIAIKKNFNVGMPWGLIHPSMPWQLMDEKAIRHTTTTGVDLLVVPTDRMVTHEGVNYRPVISAGSLWSKAEFLYGIFEIEVTLPKTDYGWPAFWLLGDHGWPPEIDIFEFLRGHLNKGKRKLTATTHWKNKNGKRKADGSWYQFVDEKRITVRLEWRRDSLRWFYNGLMVREDKKRMEHFQKPMRIIIGTGAENGYNVGVLSEVFKVHSVKYKEIKWYD